MGDVKFRGYQEVLGYFVEGSYLYTPQETNDDGISHWIVREDGLKYAIMNPETIGRYTGLKDENGKEIFEGDIVRVTDDDGSADFSDGGIGAVGGLGDLFMWYIDGEVQNGLYDIEMQAYIEIIGNIYENPELIKEDKK